MITHKTDIKNLLSTNKRLKTINKKLRLKLKVSEAENSKLKTDLLFQKNEISLLKSSDGKLENRRRMRAFTIQDYYNTAISNSEISNMAFYKACNVLYKENHDRINELIIKNSKSKNRLEPKFDDFYQNARKYKKRYAELNVK